MSRVVLVTGAARGIGLELCRQALTAGDTVLAAPRTAGGAGLAGLAEQYDRLHEVAMDVADDASIATAAETAAQRVEHIDVLFNCAGVYPKSDGGLEQLPTESLLRTFDVNAIGPLRVLQAFLPLLRRGRDKKLVQITSLMGSMADNTSGGSYAYRMSKCALNMAVRNLGHELGGEGFVCLTMHPGWVQTDMGGAAAPDGIEQACAEIRQTTLGASREQNGRFVDRRGEPLPY